jgi:hypothetical protein
MIHPVRRRFWIEVSLAATCLAAFTMTMLVPTWIEEVFGVEPDGGSGALEVAILAALLSSTVVTCWMARSEWQRAATTGS